MFYRWSNGASKEVSDSAKEINAGVARLEKLFDTLYSDTFSMMKETVSDMRSHAWSVDGTAKSNEQSQEALLQEAIRQVRQETTQQISKILSESNIQVTVKDQVEELVNNAVTKSVRVGHDAELEATKQRIMGVLAKSPRAGLAIDKLWITAGRPARFWDAVNDLKLHHDIGWKDDDPKLDMPDTEVYIT